MNDQPYSFVITLPARNSRRDRPIQRFARSLRANVERLPRIGAGLMIHLVHRRFRSLVVLLVAAVAAVAAPTRARAAEGEWFDPSRPPPGRP